MNSVEEHLKDLNPEELFGQPQLMQVHHPGWAWIDLRTIVKITVALSFLPLAGLVISAFTDWELDEYVCALGLLVLILCATTIGSLGVLGFLVIFRNKQLFKTSTIQTLYVYSCTQVEMEGELETENYEQSTR